MIYGGADALSLVQNILLVILLRTFFHDNNFCSRNLNSFRAALKFIHDVITSLRDALPYVNLALSFNNDVILYYNNGHFDNRK